MKCFHAHTPSHSPTPSHMPMTSVAIVTGNANDTQILSLCRLTNTQCNLPMGNPSQVNPDSYHSILGLSDKHDRVFSFGQQNFSAYTAGLLHPHNFSDNTTGISHPYINFGYLRGSLTIHKFHISPRVSYTHTRPFTCNDPFLAPPNTLKFYFTL